MNGSVIEAKKVMISNESSKKLVKTLTPLPEVLQTVLLSFVGVFQKYNNLRHAFMDINGCLDFDARRFQCYNGWGPFAGAVNYELSKNTRDTVVFVDDFFCYNPFHIRPGEYETDVMGELTSPDGSLTVGEIIDFMLKCELDHRPNTLCFGGPDHNHIYFENFEEGTNPALGEKYEYSIVWTVFWGS